MGGLWGSTALSYAIKNNNLKMVIKLMDAGACLSSQMCRAAPTKTDIQIDRMPPFQRFLFTKGLTDKLIDYIFDKHGLELALWIVNSPIIFEHDLFAKLLLEFQGQVADGGGFAQSQILSRVGEILSSPEWRQYIGELGVADKRLSQVEYHLRGVLRSYPQ